MNENISELHLEYTKIIFKSKTDLIVAVLTDLKFQIDLSKILDQLYHSFIHQYTEYLAQPIVSTSVFQPFKNKIDEILRQFFFHHPSATRPYSL